MQVLDLKKEMVKKFRPKITCSAHQQLQIDGVTTPCTPRMHAFPHMAASGTA